MSDKQTIGFSVRFSSLEECEKARKFINEYLYFFGKKLDYENYVQKEHFKMLEPTFILRFDLGSESSGDVSVKFEVVDENKSP